jgi:hypothetical protein
MGLDSASCRSWVGRSGRPLAASTNDCRADTIDQCRVSARAFRGDRWNEERASNSVPLGPWTRFGAGPRGRSFACDCSALHNRERLEGNASFDSTLFAGRPSRVLVCTARTMFHVKRWSRASRFPRLAEGAIVNLPLEPRAYRTARRRR